MRTFDFFISHSSATKDVARHLYYNLIANGLNPWYDESNIEATEVLEEQIFKGIDNSKGFILLHSEPAVKSQWVQMEMKIAVDKKSKDNNFKVFVIKLDNSLFTDLFWKQYLYQQWDNVDIPGSIIKLIETILGKKGVLTIAATSTLNNIPIFLNETSTLAEHSRNYVLYYLSHVKNLLSASRLTGYENELRDTINKILKLSLFEALPSIQGGRLQIAPGVWEFIYAVRKRIIPRIKVEGLPDKYGFEIIGNNKISAKILVFDKESNSPVTHPVPMTVSFDAEF